MREEGEPRAHVYVIVPAAILFIVVVVVVTSDLHSFSETPIGMMRQITIQDGEMFGLINVLGGVSR
jgi:hypothetical protein